MNVIAEKLRQAYHNDLTDVPILLDGADEIDKLCEALERFNAETIALTKRVEELDEQSRAAFEALRAERDRLRERVVKLERSQLETSIENNRLREALQRCREELEQCHNAKHVLAKKPHRRARVADDEIPF